MFKVIPTLEPESISAAKSYALVLLGRRPYSIKGLEEKLTKKGFERNVCSETVQLMKEYGYVDDLLLAERETERMLEVKRFGPLRIMLRLRQLGIDDHIVDDVIGNLDSEHVRDLCLRAAEAKLASSSHHDPKKRRANLGSYLLRRGFDSDNVNYCLRKLLI